MAADVIQADYEQLADLAARFQQQADVIERMSQRMRQNLSPLQDGGWQGTAFDTFQEEMKIDVLPAVDRLETAIVEAKSVTGLIAEFIWQADEKAAGLFRQGDMHGESVAHNHSSATEWPAVDRTGKGQTHRRSTNVPTTPASLFAFLEDTPEGYPIQVARLPNGEYLVGVQGTIGELWNPMSWLVDQSNNWLTNLLSGVGISSPYSDRVVEVIEAHLPPGSTVHLVGHSQGGHAAQMVANQLAEQGYYSVGSVRSFGAFQVRPPSPHIGESHNYLFEGDVLNILDKIEDQVTSEGAPTSVFLALKEWRNRTLPFETILNNTPSTLPLGVPNPVGLHNDYENAVYPNDPGLIFADAGEPVEVISYQAPDTMRSRFAAGVAESV